jgi:STE24 endopeptidase
MLLAMLGFAILWLVLLPFDVLEVWWQRRHGISHESYVQLIFGSWVGLGGEFLFLCLAVLIVMGLASLLGDAWWIPGGAVFVGLAAAFVYITPFLVPDQVPVRDPRITAEARELAAFENLPPIAVRVERVRRLTSSPNAEAVGLGRTRRVILWDTLLDGRFTNAQVRVVLAHELGHHARRHIAKAIGWYALFAFPGAWAIARLTRRRGGMRDPEAVPLALFVLVALAFLAAPLENAITRHMEAEADWSALEATRDPAAARSLFQRFATSAREEPSPPGWWHLLADNHPSLLERIELAQAWEARQRAAGTLEP